MSRALKSIKPKKTVGAGGSPPAGGGTAWTVASAKAHFSRVLDQAVSEGPQIVTRNGKEAAVIVSAEEWERKTKRQGALVDFLLNSPLRGADLDLERIREQPREIDL